MRYMAHCGRGAGIVCVHACDMHGGKVWAEACIKVMCCLCIYVCIYVCMHVCMYLCVFACMYACMYVIHGSLWARCWDCLCARMSYVRGGKCGLRLALRYCVCMYVCMRVCTHVICSGGEVRAEAFIKVMCLCMYVCIYVCMYVRM
jgi:hypothetical protein